LILLSLADARDIAIIVYCAIGVVIFLVAGLLTIAILFGAWRLVRRANTILKDNVQPASENVKATAQNIKGTVEYVSNTAVKPVVKVYGAAAGARRFVGVVARFTNRKSESGG
jgi:hypothetical protein